MARLALSIGVLSVGCIMPQDEYVLPEDPFFRNDPPFFVNTSPTTTIVPMKNGAGDPPETVCQYEFRASVGDPNLADTVRVRFYVDFEPPPSENQGYAIEAVLANNNQIVRPDVVVYAPNIADITHKLNSAKLHVVEAVAFDGSLTPARVPENRDSPPDAGVNPSYAVLHRWVVDVKAESCQ